MYLFCNQYKDPKIIPLIPVNYGSLWISGVMGKLAMPAYDAL